MADSTLENSFTIPGYHGYGYPKPTLVHQCLPRCKETCTAVRPRKHRLDIQNETVLVAPGVMACWKDIMRYIYDDLQHPPSWSCIDCSSDCSWP
jgi:hypothetical protein